MGRNMKGEDMSKPTITITVSRPVTTFAELPDKQWFHDEAADLLYCKLRAHDVHTSPSGAVLNCFRLDTGELINSEPGRAVVAYTVTNVDIAKR